MDAHYLKRQEYQSSDRLPGNMGKVTHMQQFSLAIADHIIAGYRLSSIKSNIHFIFTYTQTLIGRNQIGGSE